MNDLKLKIDSKPAFFIKYTDDSNFVIPVCKNVTSRTDLVEKFLRWTKKRNEI